MSNIISYLFETKAIKFCEENKPFFLTSGSISPYFVNTHFLYGNEKDATEFLSYIDTLLNDRINLPKKVFDKVLVQYQNNAIYKYLILTNTILLLIYILTIYFLFSKYKAIISSLV